MTDKHDFKAALNAVRNGHIDNFDPNYSHLDTVETALRIADRLQSGDISGEMHFEGADVLIKHEDEVIRFSDLAEKTFKAMVAQLIKEEAE